MQSKALSIVILVVVLILLCAVVIQHFAIRIGYSQIADLRTQNQLAMAQIGLVLTDAEPTAQRVAEIQSTLVDAASIEHKLQTSIRELFRLTNLLTLHMSQTNYYLATNDPVQASKSYAEFEHYSDKWKTEWSWHEALMEKKVELLNVGGE